MQTALQRAFEAGLFARPSNAASYIYRYVEHGRQLLIHVFGRDKFGNLQSGIWRTMTRREIEDEWIICDGNGDVVDPSKPRGMTLADMVA